MRQNAFVRYGATFLVCLALLFFGSALMTNIMVSKFKEDVQNQLVENNQKYVSEITKKIVSDRGETQRLADAIATIGGPVSQSTKSLVLKENWKNEEVEILVSDAKGDAYFNDGSKINIRDREFFKKAVLGETVVSESTDLMKNKETNLILVTTPIKKENLVIGTISSLREIDFYLNSFSKVIYSGESEIGIVNAKDMSPIAGSTLADFSEEIDLSIIANSEAGGIIVEKLESGDIQYISYEPLAMNDWYMINYVDSSILYPRKIMLRTAAGSVAGLATILFAALLLGLYLSEKKRDKFIEKVALYHHLTGLPNWQYLLQNFDKLTENRTMVYLLMRIPDFRRISGVFGYPVAARMLKDIAGEFKMSMEEDDVAVHVSEDCFALLLVADRQRDRIDRKINSIFQKLEAIAMKDTNVIYDYHCSFSGGAYLLDNKKEDLGLVNRCANLVIEAQPKENGVFWGWYETAMNEKITLQEALMSEILRALQNEEFVPFFQPQYNIDTGEVIGAEVLARWEHPTRGILLPGVFVPLLEAKGCVLELDLIMLEQACKMIREWLAKGILPVPMSVNISRLNIHRRDFVNRVITIAHKYDIPTNLIALEMDETAIMENSGKASILARKFKEEGFVLSMDDFGSGNSSLNMLREIHIDIIKLSRSFLQKFKDGERSKPILSHVVGMLNELNVQIVAEGVETKEQEEMIREVGCKYAQGFYYNKPMAAEDFEKIMSE